MTKSAGSSTVQTVNPAQQAQQPFLTDLYSTGQPLFHQQTGSPWIEGLQGAALNSGIYSQPFTAGLGGFAGNTLGNILQGGLPAQSQQTALNNLSYLAGPYGVTQPNINAITGYGNQVAGLGSTFPGITQPFANQLSNIAGQAQTASNPMIGGLMNNPATASLQNQANGAFLGPNPYLSQAIAAAQDPTVRSFETATMPQLQSGFESAGRYGSGAEFNAQDQAQKNLGYSLANIATPMAFQGYQAGLQNMLGAGSALGSIWNQGQGAAGQLAQSQLTGAGNLTQAAGQEALAGPQAYLNALQQAGGLQQQAGALANQGIGIGIQGYGTSGQLANAGTGWDINAATAAPSLAQFPQQQYQAALAAPWLPFGSYSSVIGGTVPGSQTTSTPQFQNVGANILSTGLGALQLGNALNAATSAGGLLSATGPFAFLSDRRLKTDIERIGVLKNGLPLYRYRFQGQDWWQIGLMADEVEQIHPEAVRMRNGYRTVDYARAVI